VLIFLGVSEPLRENAFEDAVLFRAGYPNVRIGVNSYSESERVYPAAWRDGHGALCDFAISPILRFSKRKETRQDYEVGVERYRTATERMLAQTIVVQDQNK